ncbi:hypothetical protein GCM10027258_79450 [Amycolatopsis stemonae]
MPKVSAVQKSAELWQGLNERQQTWLIVIYRADQDAEASARGAFARGERSRPASQWRWLDYGIVDDPLGSGPSGDLQFELNQRKVWDQGAGSTMTVLIERGLIQVKREPLMIGCRMLIKLTTLGRAVARAGGADDTEPARRRPPGMLSETMWSMLVDVRRAGKRGVLRYTPSGAWDALAERDPALVQFGRDPGGSGKTSITLTDAGVAHYTDGWQEYARLYPGVAAPHPDPNAEPVWPREVDARLGQLADAVAAIGTDLRTLATQLRELETLGELPPVPGKGAVPEFAAAVKLRRERHRRAERQRQLAGEHREQLLGLYRNAIARYVAVAAAVVTAAAEGRDPRTVLDADPAVLDENDRLVRLDCPRTGLAGVDREIAVAHRAAAKGAKPARRREDREREERSAPAGRQLAAVNGFGAHLRALVANGQLARLLLRRDA